MCAVLKSEYSHAFVCVLVFPCVSMRCDVDSFYKRKPLSRFMHKDPHRRAHTLTHRACSVTRRKETQGEAAHLTGIQLSVSNGGHPGEEKEGSRPVVMKESGGQFPLRPGNTTPPATQTHPLSAVAPYYAKRMLRHNPKLHDTSYF